MRARIFGIGLMKTGTNSLRAALEILGYKSLHGGHPETMWTVQRAIDEGVPILTVRDPDEWLDSRRRHVEKNAKLKAEGKYDGVLVEVNLKAWATEYRRHEAVARADFDQRPADLLVLNVANDGGEPLCQFLGRPLPEEPFPWQNQYEPLASPTETTP